MIAYVAFGCTNRFGGGAVFYKIPCDKETEIVAYLQGILNYYYIIVSVGLQHS